jgi:hypothetical protein
MTHADDTPLAGAKLFTPVDRRSGERLRLWLDKDTVIPRGRRWSRVVVDLATGTSYRAGTKSCGSPRCMCDAYAERVNGDEFKAEEPRLRANWCECLFMCDEPIYMPDGVCPCGEWKHHYHCCDCLGLSQVG